jgi:hypothetical protein
MNKSLLFFGILLGSFITLFIILFYNISFNPEKFYVGDSENENTPIEVKSEMQDSQISEKSEMQDIVKMPKISDKLESAISSSMCDNISTLCNSGNFSSTLLNQIIDNEVLEMNDYEIFEANVQSNLEHNEYPYNEDILMQISTFNKNLINNSTSKWYDTINYNVSSSNTDNDKLWFNLDNVIEIIDNKNFASGANLKNVQLSGPSAMHFSSNHLNALGDISLIFTLKINDLDIIEPDKESENKESENKESENKEGCLFKLPLQEDTNITNGTDNIEGGTIALIISRISKNYIRAKLYFAEYSDNKNKPNPLIWNNIPINIIKKNIVIALTYSPSIGATLYIDNLVKIFPITTSKMYKLGSTPLIINENSNMDMILYNFTYYKKRLTDDEFSNFISVNDYLINNKNKINDEYISTINRLNLSLITKDSLIKTVENNCANNKII